MSKTVLTQKIEKALLTQIKNEFRISSLYLSASYFFSNRHFHGISCYLKKEYQSELAHGFSISDYMSTRGSDLTIKIIDIQGEIGLDNTIKEEALKWQKPVDIFEFFCNTEQQNQLDINKLMKLSQNENDHGTYQFLLSFIKQQIECSHQSEDILAKVKSFSSFEGLLWHLDSELS